MTPHLTALGFTLIHVCWQAALIGGLYKLLELTLPRLRNAERYLMGLVAMVAILAIAVGTFVFEDLRLAREPVIVALNPTLEPTLSAAPSAGASLVKDLEKLLPWLDAAWIVGVAVLALRMAGGLWLIRRLEAAALAVPDAVLARFRVLVQRAGLTSVEIRLHPAIDGPFVIGALRAVVYLPLSAVTALTPDQLDAVLAHELEHVRRADYLWNLVQSAIETLFFFHPVVWWLGARLREQRELCCDDAAVRLCRDPLTYATALLHLEEQRRSTPRFAMALNGQGSGSKLVSRIARLLGERTGSANTGPAGKGRTPAAYALPVIVLVLFAFGAPGAGVAARNTLQQVIQPGKPADKLKLDTIDLSGDVSGDTSGEAAAGPESPAPEMNADEAAIAESQSRPMARNVARTPDLAARAEADRAATEATASQRAFEVARDTADRAGNWFAQTFSQSFAQDFAQNFPQNLQWNDAWKAEAQHGLSQAELAALQNNAEWEKAQAEWEKSSAWGLSKEEQEAIRAEALAARQEAIEEIRMAREEHEIEVREAAEEARRETEEALADAQAERENELREATEEARRDAEDARNDAREAARFDAEAVRSQREASESQRRASQSQARAAADDARRQSARLQGTRGWRVLPPEAPAAPEAPAPVAAPLPAPRPAAAPRPTPAPAAVPAAPRASPVAPAAPAAPVAPLAAIKVTTSTLVDLKPMKINLDMPMTISFDKPVKVKIDKPVKVSKVKHGGTLGFRED